jgi:acyl carrier protein
MNDKKNIRDVITSAIRDALPKKYTSIEIEYDLDLRSDLDIDSMGFIIIASALERELEINIDDLAVKLPEIKTVDDFYICVSQLRNTQ